MSDKNKLIGVVLAILIAFAVGRYSVSQQTNKSNEVVVKVDKKVEEDTHTKTKTIIVKDKDGNETTTIEQETDKSAKSDIKSSSDNKSSVVAIQRSKVNVSLLGGYDFKQKELNYGISVSKEFIGPITIGAFGMNNGIIGVSVGLNF